MVTKKKVNKNRAKRWYSTGEPEGTDEELLEAYNINKEYTYKLLSYADKDGGISKEELDRLKRIFIFATQGPRASHFVFGKRNKLVSADILYILSCSVPAKNLAETFGVSSRHINYIRQGRYDEWKLEYDLVKRLGVVIRGHIRSIKSSSTTRIYSLSRITPSGNKEVLYYLSSRRKAIAMRNSFITKAELNKLTKSESLDIVYPIDQIEILK